MLELWVQHRLRLGGPVGRARRPRAARARIRGGLIAVTALAALLVLAALSGCGQSAPGGSGGGGGTESGDSNGASSPLVASSAGASAAPGSPSTSSSVRAASTRGSATGRAGAGAGRGGSGLAYSNAPADVVQTQPAPGSCHAIGSGVYERPDRHCTPGALNPTVTQASIGQTICRPGWTKTVRPSVDITDQEKSASMAAYGDTGSTSAYEYDHLVPLELGGAVNDARNLWPEPGGSPNPKDSVEDELRRQVCDGQETLAQAQRAIAANWVTLARAPKPGGSSWEGPASSTGARSSSGAECTVRASYSSRYHDYDVYVHSNQPGHTVVVTDASGQSASWHTDAAGYADVYLRAAANQAGEGVIAHVGGATCHGLL